LLRARATLDRAHWSAPGRKGSTRTQFY